MPSRPRYLAPARILERISAVYLADIGFRLPGVRLVAPVHATDGGRTVTLTDLVATPEGTDISYYMTGLGDEAYLPLREIISVRRNEDEHVVTRGTFSFAPDQHPPRRRISSRSLAPAWTGPVDVTVAIAGLGEFHLPAVLRTFGPDTDAPRRDVNRSATHEGITLTIHGVGTAREETAIEIEAEMPEGECCVGIGAYNGHRLGPSALVLSDDAGRRYLERWQEPGPDDHKTVALFQPVHADARELRLSVPSILVEEPVVTTAFALPIAAPIDVHLGRYMVRVLGIHAATGRRLARTVAEQTPRLEVDLELGGWHGDRRVLSPGRPVVDGDWCSVGWSGLRDMRQPEPVTRMTVTGTRALSAKALGFSRPIVQVRGPWELRFPVV